MKPSTPVRFPSAPKFGELPPASEKEGATRGRPDRLLGIAAALRERPGEWAIIGTYASPRTAMNTAANARAGSYAMRAFGPGFETAVRDCDLWVRYVGGES